MTLQLWYLPTKSKSKRLISPFTPVSCEKSDSQLQNVSCSEVVVVYHHAGKFYGEAASVLIESPGDSHRLISSVLQKGLSKKGKKNTRDSDNGGKSTRSFDKNVQKLKYSGHNERCLRLLHRKTLCARFLQHLFFQIIGRSWQEPMVHGYELSRTIASSLALFL